MRHVAKPKPIRRRIVKRLPIPRALPPDYEPLTPGLRHPKDAGECIGFHAPFIEDGDDE